MKEPFNYSMIRVRNWFELSETMKVEMVLNAIDELYFPYKEEIYPQNETSYRSYMEYANDMAKNYDLVDINPLSSFWGTEWSEVGKREKFTKMVKEIVDRIFRQLYNSNPHGWFMSDSIYLTAWKSTCVEIQCEGDPSLYCEISAPQYDQWDAWKLGYIELIIRIMDYVMEKSFEE